MKTSGQNPVHSKKRGEGRIARAGSAGLIGMAAIVIGLLTLGTAGLVYWQLDRSLIGAQSEGQRHRLRVVAEVVEQRVVFYRNLVHRYAEDPRIRDMIAFADDTGAVAWSQQVRRLLPNVVGAALYDGDEGVYGEPGALRLGAQCVRDLHDRVVGNPVPMLPVHDAIPALAHFDVVAPVHDQSGDVIGAVFVSFSIDELFEMLARVASDRSGVALIDTISGRVIASSPNWRALRGAPMRSAGVDGSNWELQVRFAEDDVPEMMSTLAWQGVGGILLIVIVLVVGVGHIRRRQREEIGRLCRFIDGLRADEPAAPARLAACCAFFPDGDRLRDTLHDLAAACPGLQADGCAAPVTGLVARSSFRQRVDDLLTRNRQGPGGDGFSLVALQLDDLAGLKDVAGGKVADRVTQALADAVLAGVRGSDVATQWRDDRFAVLLPRMTAAQLALWMDRMRCAFAERQTALSVEIAQAFDCRIGFAQVQVGADDDRDADALLGEADHQLVRYRRGAGAH